MNETIFLDNNSTTKIDPRVLEAMMPYFTDIYANASSTHKFGLEADKAVKNARKQISTLLGCESHEVIFTSGATEAINLAIKGVAEQYKDKGKHIITVTTEHSAVLDTCRFLETIGYEVTYLKVEPDGLLDLDLLEKSIRNDTILVSVMYVNNEIGVIQQIKEIADITHNRGSVFFTDATQAVGKLKFSVDELGIDLLSFSGHKIYGPKGIGALFIRSRNPRKLKIPPLLHGGGHERGLRSGTLNVPLIVGLGKACEIAENEMKKNEVHIRKLRDKLESELLKLEGTSVNGSRENRLYNVTNISFNGINSEALIIGLDNIAVSNGSACTSTSVEPSHVLKALGLSNDDAMSAIRFSLSKYNNQNEIKKTNNTLHEIVKNLKQLIE